MKALRTLREKYMMPTNQNVEDKSYNDYKLKIVERIRLFFAYDYYPVLSIFFLEQLNICYCSLEPKIPISTQMISYICICLLISQHIGVYIGVIIL